MKELVIKPMQWAKTADLHDVSPLDESDVTCMQEIREVLMKHEKVDRFALHLIHKHFDLDDDEILVEYSDPSPREQFFRVEKRTDDIMQHSIPTTWTLEQMEPMARCTCAYRQGKGHLGRHETA